MSERSPIPTLARCLVLLALSAMALQVIARGFLPTDDARRHAAKAVSGREWGEILVLRPDITLDSHPGWHATLAAVHRVTGAGPHGLVLFSIVSLFLAYSLAPLLLMRRPEAWLVALLALGAIDPPKCTRLLIGRPLLASAGFLILLALLWAYRQGALSRGQSALLALLFGGVAWMHPSWYLFALPVVACALGAEPRLALRLSAVLGAGVLIAALLSGQPGTFLVQSVHHGFLALGEPLPLRSLAAEFLPQVGSPLLLLLLAGLWLLRHVRGAWDPATLRGPLPWLALLGWALGFVVMRFWADWGLPVVLLLIALEVEALLESCHAEASLARLKVVALAGVLSFLAVSSDLGGRYSERDAPYAVLLSPAAAPLLPEPGGILYSDDMALFFQLFYHRPTAPWRYVLGYEPGLMRVEDRRIFTAAVVTRSFSAFDPWLERLRPEDRLIIPAAEGEPPARPGIVWTRVTGTIWVARRAS